MLQRFPFRSADFILLLVLVSLHTVPGIDFTEWIVTSIGPSCYKCHLKILSFPSDIKSELKLTPSSIFKSVYYVALDGRRQLSTLGSSQTGFRNLSYSRLHGLSSAFFNEVRIDNIWTDYVN